jgi:hypothetical protein
MPKGGEKTMNNTSSVQYNIISPTEQNTLTGVVIMKCLDKKIASKKKGVGEFSDLTRPFNPNYFDKYKEAIDENKYLFKKYNGIFSHLYDAAHKNGDIIVPFRFDKDRLNIQKESEKRKIYLSILKAKYDLKNKQKVGEKIVKNENLQTNHSSQSHNVTGNNQNFFNNPQIANNNVKKVDKKKKEETNPKPAVNSNVKK